MGVTGPSVGNCPEMEAQMVLLYVSIGRIGTEDCGMNLEFSGATWEEAWAKINVHMTTKHWADCWYKIFA